MTEQNMPSPEMMMMIAMRLAKNEEFDSNVANNVMAYGQVTPMVAQGSPEDVLADIAIRSAYMERIEPTEEEDAAMERLKLRFEAEAGQPE